MIERKIQRRMINLLAMSKDKGSPNEAAIAERRLDTMCAEHGITVSDVERGNFGVTMGRTRTTTDRVQTVGWPHGSVSGGFPHADWVIFDETPEPPMTATEQSILDDVIRNFVGAADNVSPVNDQEMRDSILKTMEELNEALIRSLLK